MVTVRSRAALTYGTRLLPPYACTRRPSAPAASRRDRDAAGANITFANRPECERRCLGRPARRTERDDHRVAAPAGERQPIGQSLADHAAAAAHQLADDDDRIREVAV